MKAVTPSPRTSRAPLASRRYTAPRVASRTTPWTCARCPTGIRQRELQEGIDRRRRAGEGVGGCGPLDADLARRGHQQLGADQLSPGVEPCRRDRGHADQAVDGDLGGSASPAPAIGITVESATRPPPDRRRRGRPNRVEIERTMPPTSTSWLSSRPEMSCSSRARVAVGSLPAPAHAQGMGDQHRRKVARPGLADDLDLVARRARRHRMRQLRGIDEDAGGVVLDE